MTLASIYKQPGSAAKLAERFWEKVDVGDCWEWTAARDRDGYGLFSVATRLKMAHRVAYELLVGVIPDGLVIDHLCRNRACVNPDHLEPVTTTENIRRGFVSPPPPPEPKAECLRGHAFTEENTFLNSGRRICRECSRARSRDHWRKKNGWVV